MKIIRNGQEIELTAEELRSAYLEEERNHYQKVVIDSLRVRAKCDDSLDAVAARNVLKNFDEVCAVADEVQYELINWDSEWETMVSVCMDDILARRTDEYPEVSVGDYIETPRFLRARIEDVFYSLEAAEKAGYTEPTHFRNDFYEVLGRSVGSNCMEFAAVYK